MLTPPQCVESALVHHRAGRLAEAEALYREALAADAKSFDAWHMLGVVHQQIGQSGKAVELIGRAVSITPGNHFAHSNLGLAYQSLNRLDDAEASLRRAVALKPDWDGAHNSLGTVLRAAGRIDEAEASFRTAVQLNPANSDALVNLGKLCSERGRLVDAIDCFSKALQIDGSRFDATYDAGDVLRRLDRLDEAESFARKALAIRPDDPDALKALACVLLRISQVDEAEACCRRSLSIRSDDAATQITLGNILIAGDRTAEAEACFRSALRLQPSSATARYNLSILKLSQGEYKEGLELYESRFDALREDFGILPEISERLKDGRRWHGESLSGKRLLIWTEQGFGDSLMMLRYLPMLKERGASEVIVLCERALERVAGSLSGMSVGVSAMQTVSADQFDLHCPIMSLPFLLDTTIESIPNRVPYVAVPEKLSAAWNQRLSPITKPRVGLSWAGSATVRIAGRSIPLEAFDPIIRSSSVQLISLQKEEGAAQVGAWRGRIEDWMDDCEDFMDTAALVQNLDLVISIDSAVAHLAGALGKPVWLLNRHKSEWRWGRLSERTPWYPTMRIFRQQRATGWDQVIAQVAEELSTFQRKQDDRGQP